MISYQPLFHTLLDKEMYLTELCEALKISSGTRAKFNKGEYVSLEKIERICLYLNVPIENVVEIKRS